jgi:hypothetical protein
MLCNSTSLRYKFIALLMVLVLTITLSSACSILNSILPSKTPPTKSSQTSFPKPTILTSSLVSTSAPGNQEGKTKWQLVLDPNLTTVCDPAIGPEGNIYVTASSAPGSGVAKLFAVNPNGTQKWNFKLNGSVASSPVVALDGTIYVVSEVSIFAISSSGIKKWEWKDPKAAGIGSLALAANGTIFTGHVGAGVYLRDIMSISPDGVMKWTTNLSGTSHSGLTVGTDGKIYLISNDYGTANYPLRAVDPGTGSVLWSLPLGGWDTSSMAIGADGTIYKPLGNKLTAVKPDGAIKWQYVFPNNCGVPSIGLDGTVYTVVASSGLFALSSNGTPKWNVGGASGAPGNTIVRDGTIYFCGSNPDPQGGFTAVNSNGTIKWTLDIPAGGGNPAVDSDGMIYVAGGSAAIGGAKLTAVYGSAPLGPSPWSRARHDNRNTGSYQGD